MLLADANDLCWLCHFQYPTHTFMVKIISGPTSPDWGVLVDDNLCLTLEEVRETLETLGEKDLNEAGPFPQTDLHYLMRAEHIGTELREHYLQWLTDHYLSLSDQCQRRATTADRSGGLSGEIHPL